MSGKGRGVKNFRGSMRSISDAGDDDNEDSPGPIPDTIEFQARIEKELAEFDLFSLYELQKILTRVIRDRVSQTIWDLEHKK